jgi:hypothetical protein
MRDRNFGWARSEGLLMVAFFGDGTKFLMENAFEKPNRKTGGDFGTLIFSN